MSSSRVLSCLPLSSDVTGSSSFLPSLMSSSLMSFSKFLSCLPLFTDVTSDVIFPPSFLPTSLLWIHLHWCHLRVFFSSHFSSLISSSVMSSSPLPCLPLVLHRLTVPCMMFFMWVLMLWTHGHIISVSLVFQLSKYLQKEPVISWIVFLTFSLAA